MTQPINFEITAPGRIHAAWSHAGGNDRPAECNRAGTRRFLLGVGTIVGLLYASAGPSLGQLADPYLSATPPAPEAPSAAVRPAPARPHVYRPPRHRSPPALSPLPVPDFAASPDILIGPLPQPDGAWLTDPRTGCRLLKLAPPYRSIRWSAACNGGVIVGEGRLLLLEGDRVVLTYDGGVTEGRVTGRGTFTMRDGSRLYGRFVDGFPVGRLVFYAANGARFEAQMGSGGMRGCLRVGSEVVAVSRPQGSCS